MLPISFLWMWLFLICITFRIYYGRPIPHMLPAWARSTVEVRVRRVIMVVVMTFGFFWVSVRVGGLLGRGFIEFPRLVVYTTNCLLWVLPTNWPSAKNEPTFWFFLPTAFIINHILSPGYPLSSSISTFEDKSTNDVGTFRVHGLFFIALLRRVTCNRKGSGGIRRVVCLWSSSDSTHLHRLVLSLGKVGSGAPSTAVVKWKGESITWHLYVNGRASIVLIGNVRFWVTGTRSLSQAYQPLPTQ